jgi:transcriptional regulator with XRE-family HTH domain
MREYDPSIEPIYREVGRRLREARKARKYSLRQLSAKLSQNVSAGAISLYENAEIRIPLSMLYEIANALDCDVKDFLP